MKDQFKSGRLWVDAAVILTLAVALLYLYGDAYQTGYLKEFGLSRDLFMQSVERTLVTGFHITLLVTAKGAKLGIKPMLTLLIALYGLLAVLLISIRIVRKKWVLSELLYQRDEETKKAGVRSPFIRKMLVVAFIYFVISLFFLIIVVFWRFAWKEGEQRAKHHKHEMDRGSAEFTKALILYEGDKNKMPKQLKGYIVAASPSGYAVYIESKVYFISSSQLIQISFPIK